MDANQVAQLANMSTQQRNDMINSIQAGSLSRDQFNQWFPQQGVGANPADFYGPTADNTTNALNTMVGGDHTADHTGSGAGYDFLNNLIGGNNQPPSLPGMNLPGALTLNQPNAPGTYQSGYNATAATGPNIAGPSFDTMNLPGFNSGGIAGPGQTQVRDPNRGDFAGPSGGSAAITNAAGQVATDALALEAFGGALEGNRAMAAGGAIDTGALDEAAKKHGDALMAQARYGGTLDAGARGFGGAGQNDVLTTAQMHATAPVAAQLAKERGERELQAQQFNVEQQAGALGRQTELGSAAAGATHGTQELNVGAAVNVGNQMVQEFNAGTQRGQVMGNMMQNADQLRQSGNIEGYKAETQRMATQYGISEGQASAMIDGYRAATDRGQVSQQARQAAANMGLDYEKMAMQNSQFAASIGLDYNRLNETAQARGAHNLLQMNQQMTDIYGIMSKTGVDAFTASSNALNQQYSNQTGRINSMIDGMKAMGGLRLGETAQSNQMMTSAAQIAAGLLDGQVSADIAFQQLQQQADAGNQQAQMTLYLAQQSMIHDTSMQNRGQRHEENMAEGGGIFGDIVGTIGGSLAGMAGGWLGGQIFGDNFAGNPGAAEGG